MDWGVSDADAAKWREFCSKALGTSSVAPLKDAAGVAISALTSAFRECYPLPSKSTELPDFGAEIYHSPWTVYVIRNEATAEVYVGLAEKGFSQRYPGGEWWMDHHNPGLARDALMYGVRHFKIAIHVCKDAMDMRQTEAMLIRMHRPATYNLRPEPDCAK